MREVGGAEERLLRDPLHELLFGGVWSHREADDEFRTRAILAFGNLKYVGRFAEWAGVTALILMSLDFRAAALALEMLRGPFWRGRRWGLDLMSRATPRTKTIVGIKR